MKSSTIMYLIRLIDEDKIKFEVDLMKSKANALKAEGENKTLWVQKIEYLENKLKFLNECISEILSLDIDDSEELINFLDD